MILTFDVETRGLFGQSFAVGFVLTSDAGSTLFEGIRSCLFMDVDPDGGSTWKENDAWLEENVLPHLPAPDCFTAFEVRHKFMDDLRSMKRAADRQDEKLYLLADCAFPCEARFLTECWRDDPLKNGPLMPYPLLDLSAILLAKGYDPVGMYARRDNENPTHNPLNDARQSSRIYHHLMRGEPVE